MRDGRRPRADRRRRRRASAGDAASRVVVLDGFAGRGRYPDGTPASAELIMQAVRGLQGSRQVAMFFAETDPSYYQPLAKVVSEYTAQGLDAKALPGSVDDHLDAVLNAARGVPLFVFLDPCGALLPFQRLARMVGQARRSTRPATEVLLNFSAGFTRRTAGQLAAGRAGELGITRLDVTCGGPWWHGSLWTPSGPLRPGTSSQRRKPWSNGTRSGWRKQVPCCPSRSRCGAACTTNPCTTWSSSPAAHTGCGCLPRRSARPGGHGWSRSEGSMTMTPPARARCGPPPTACSGSSMAK